jgi:uncharacterized membrane protein
MGDQIKERMMVPIQHIHPMLVHFPIVLIVLLAGTELVAAFRGATVMGRTAMGNVSTGLVVLLAISSVAAYYFGGIALDVAEAGGFHSDIAETHEGLGEMVAALTVVYALIRAGLWWRDTRITGLTTIAAASVAIMGLALISSTAFYGGQLVYDLGVNVQKVVVN